MTAEARNFEVFVVDRKGQAASLPVPRDEYLETIPRRYYFATIMYGSPYSTARNPTSALKKSPKTTFTYQGSYRSELASDAAIASSPHWATVGRAMVARPNV
jgi:hypothetical protein